MSLIKSISGIRGTIGGSPGQSLTPPDIIAFTSAYGQWVKQQAQPKSSASYRVVVGRDARISGRMVEALVCNTLISMGIDVVSAGLATTPTVEMAVGTANADGGIIITASHNPAHWNALKLLNSHGEFLSADDGDRLLQLIEEDSFDFAGVDALGTIVEQDFLDEHIKTILNLPLVNVQAIQRRGFRVVVDAVNSVGGFAVPKILHAIGVVDVLVLNANPDGNFAHNPEPIPENLTEICSRVVLEKADLGIVVDPDVDRLAFINEDGSFFGEEYTLVAVSDYILSSTPGNTVSNLSSTRALSDVTRAHGGRYHASAVGEVNVVEMMKATGAVIGGEGNGGIIYPEIHYGRDALVGIALFLSYLAEKGVSMSEFRKSYPDYAMSKNKIELTSGADPGILLESMQKKYSGERITTIDGVKIDFEESWVHMRKSNTEPIIRIYTEAPDQMQADELAIRFIRELEQLANA